MQGYIQLHRKLIEWEWATSPEMVSLFVFLLLLANHKETMWRGHKIEAGQILTGRKQLSALTGISEQTIRTCLERLKSTHEITIKSTNRFSVITILNYAKYQVLQKHQPANQPTTNQQLTTSNNDNNDNNNINIYIDHQKDKIFNQLIEDFVKMRKSIKKPLTDRGLKIILNKLKDHNILIAKKMLENSIESNWQSIYPLKQEEAEGIYLSLEREKKEDDDFTPEQIEANKNKLNEIRKKIF